ncbi:MAG TPA: hypothetical protein VHA14_01920 [Bryobacteraceae bacterium]|nr:hypothetical protein [Bryobacteraceae bacterium]
MADSFDPKLVPELLRAGFSVSIGAAFKGLEMIARPTESLPKVVAGMTDLLTVPEGTGDTLPEKVQAMAGVWLARGATIVVDCKAKGDKFTEGK